MKQLPGNPKRLLMVSWLSTSADEKHSEQEYGRPCQANRVDLPRPSAECADMIEPQSTD